MSQNDLVSWFRESASYIEQHRDTTLVVDLCSDMLVSNRVQLLTDIAVLHKLGVRIVIVYGARNQIDDALAHHGVVSTFVHNMRMTSRDELEIIKGVVGTLQTDITVALSSHIQQAPVAFGAHASESSITVSNGNFVVAQPVGVINGHDYQFTGNVRKINHAALRAQLNHGHIALISPLGYSPSGEVFNLSAHDVSVATAQALQADKLVFLTDTRALQDDDTTLDVLTPEQGLRLAQSTKIPITMQHTLRCAASATQNGVARVHLLSSTMQGSLFYELYTRDGVGTMMTTHAYQTIRPADIDDVSSIIALLEPQEAQGTVVYRSREQIELDIQRFIVMLRDGTIIGCIALHPYEREKTAEISCLIVSPEYSNAGRGNALLTAACEQAHELCLESVFILTTQAEHWFKERGFEQSSTEHLPADKRSFYNWQRQSKVMFKTLQ